MLGEQATNALACYTAGELFNASPPEPRFGTCQREMVCLPLSLLPDSVLPGRAPLDHFWLIREDSTAPQTAEGVESCPFYLVLTLQSPLPPRGYGSFNNRDAHRSLPGSLTDAASPSPPQTVNSALSSGITESDSLRASSVPYPSGNFQGRTAQGLAWKRSLESRGVNQRKIL